MASILLSETQIQMIKNQLLKEDLDNRYRKTVEVDMNNYGITFKGKEVELEQFRKKLNGIMVECKKLASSLNHFTLAPK